MDTYSLRISQNCIFYFAFFFSFVLYSIFKQGCQFRGKGDISIPPPLDREVWSMLSFLKVWNINSLFQNMSVPVKSGKPSDVIQRWTVSCWYDMGESGCLLNEIRLCIFSILRTRQKLAFMSTCSSRKTAKYWIKLER